MLMKKVKNTIRCVVCLSYDVVCMGGHVHKGKEKVIASLCREHMLTDAINDKCKGCYGAYKKEMGIEKF